jgi:hypothetical protein
MSQRLVTSQINTNIPDAYPFITVQSVPSNLGASGILVIFGEADGGDSYQNVVLKNNSFGPNQLNKVKQQYVSGQIVDAFSALASPSNDTDITGSANLIYIVKTNQGTKASAVVPTLYGTFMDKNWGVPGNKYSFQITSIAAEVAPTLSGGTIAALGAPLNGTSFTIRLEGGAETVVTLSGTAGDHDTIPHLVQELNEYTFTVTSANATAGATYTNNGQTFTVLATIVAGTTLLCSGTGAPLASGTLTKTTGTGDATITFSAFSRKLPEGISASAGAAPTSIALTIDADSSAYGKGWGKSFELFDSTPGDLSALGLTAGLYTSSVEPGVEIGVFRPDIGLSQAIDVNAQIAFTIGYLGTTATLSISGTSLTTTVTGGSGTNLTIDMSQYRTVADLAGFINSQTGYTAAATPAGQQKAPSALDVVTTIGIASTGSGLMPGRVKSAASAFSTAANNSALEFEATSPAGLSGLPAPMASPVFLSGGARGATLAADIVAALAQLQAIQCNIIIPLFSQDAADDTLLGLTDSSSTYTIAAVNAATKNHCINMSTPELKRNRSAIMSILDTYENAKAQAQGLGNYRCSLTMQEASQVNSVGVITVFQPWYTACVAAGMQAGGFYKAIVNKAANVISFTDPAGFDSGDPADISDALNAGLLFLSADTTRNYWVSDQTTYGLDTNFVYNSIQAVYGSDLLALDLAQSFKLNFVGKSLADVDAAAGLAYLAQKMDGYKKIKLIASSNDAPLGYKNQHIEINGPEMDVSVDIKLATAIYFIPININISQVQSAA